MGVFREDDGVQVAASLSLATGLARPFATISDGTDWTTAVVVVVGDRVVIAGSHSVTTLSDPFDVGSLAAIPRELQSHPLADLQGLQLQNEVLVERPWIAVGTLRPDDTALSIISEELPDGRVLHAEVVDSERVDVWLGTPELSGLRAVSFNPQDNHLTASHLVSPTAFGECGRLTAAGAWISSGSIGTAQILTSDVKGGEFVETERVVVGVEQSILRLDEAGLLTILGLDHPEIERGRGSTIGHVLALDPVNTDFVCAVANSDRAFIVKRADGSFVAFGSIEEFLSARGSGIKYVYV